MDFMANVSVSSLSALSSLIYTVPAPSSGINSPFSAYTDTFILLTAFVAVFLMVTLNSKLSPAVTLSPLIL